MMARKFGRTPIGLGADDRLRKVDLRVLITLCEFVNRNWEAWPSQSKLAERSGLSRTSVNKALNHLEELGHITRTKRMSAQGTATSTLYHVNPVVYTDDNPGVHKGDNHGVDTNRPGNRPTEQTSLRGANAPEREIRKYIVGLVAAVCSTPGHEMSPDEKQAIVTWLFTKYRNGEVTFTGDISEDRHLIL